MCLSMFCLFGVFRPTREFFTHMETSRWPVMGCILTYARHLWPLSSEGFLACHIYYDMGHPVIMVISENPWHSHLLPSVWQRSYHYLFYFHCPFFKGSQLRNRENKFSIKLPWIKGIHLCWNTPCPFPNGDFEKE